MVKFCVYGILVLLLVSSVFASASSVVLDDGRVYASAFYEPFNLWRWLGSVFGTSFSVVGFSQVSGGTSAEFTFVVDTGACVGKTDVGISSDGYANDNVASSVSLKNSAGYYYAKKSFTFSATTTGYQTVCAKYRCSASGGVYYQDSSCASVYVTAPKVCADYGYVSSVPSGKTCVRILPLGVIGGCYKDCVVISKTCADYGYVSSVPSGKTCTQMSLSDVSGYCYRNCVTAPVKSCADYGLYASSQSGMSCSLTPVTGTSLSCYVCEEIQKTCSDYGLYPSSQSGMSCTADNSKGISCYSCESIMPTCEDYGLYASEQSGMSCVADSTNGLSCYDCSAVGKTCADYGLYGGLYAFEGMNCSEVVKEGLTCYDCSGTQSCSGITLGSACLEGQKLGITIGVAVIVLMVIVIIMLYLKKNKPQRGKRMRR